MGMFGQALRESSTDWLVAKWIAVKEGRYPAKTKYAETNQRRLKEEIDKRVPDGVILVWSHRKVRR